MKHRYRGTYVIEKIPDEGDPLVLFSVSHELEGPHVVDVHEHLLSGVSEKIVKLQPVLASAEDEPEPPHIEVVPNAPTIKSVNNDKE